MLQTGQNYTAARADLLSESYDAARRAHVRVVGRFLIDGRLVSVPVKRKVRAEVLLALVELFEPGRSYLEAEVNAILCSVWDDYAYLRREMVNYGYLQRDSGIYQLPDAAPERLPHYRDELPMWEELWLPDYLAGR